LVGHIQLYAKFSLPTKTWEVSTDKVAVDKWHKVELSWDAERGLQMFVDGVQVASTSTPAIHLPLRTTDRVVYVGRPNNDNLGGRYADAVVDELDFWYAGRNRLIALGLLDVGKTLHLRCQDVAHLAHDHTALDMSNLIEMHGHLARPFVHEGGWQTELIRSVSIFRNGSILVGRDTIESLDYTSCLWTVSRHIVLSLSCSCIQR
jgi:Concanavalin A-like lectin/glucanases superfamily